MNPLIHMCYMAAYRDNQDFRDLARWWNTENKRYYENAKMSDIKKDIRRFRLKYRGNGQVEWKDFDVPRYMAFINQNLYWKE